MTTTPTTTKLNLIARLDSMIENNASLIAGIDSMLAIALSNPLLDTYAARLSADLETALAARGHLYKRRAYAITR